MGVAIKKGVFNFDCLRFVRKKDFFFRFVCNKAVLKEMRLFEWG
ncbi:hypothetical protein HMPREF1434_00404 [Helicobacter pylori GAMchJs124i]|nr:hypothetical protein HMPREF1434_00404 [Helicobacter pylori GAMchJs124i]